MKTTHTYTLETYDLDRWMKILSGNMHYLQGFLDARADYAPRLAYRIMRSDGKVIEQIDAREDVNIGQVAGWPTAAQYERAAEKAMERAKAIRENENREAGNRRRLGIA